MLTQGVDSKQTLEKGARFIRAPFSFAPISLYLAMYPAIVMTSHDSTTRG